MSDTIQTAIEKTAEELLNALTISAQIQVGKTEEMYTLHIETEETGLLIGHHGATLNAFQFIIASVVFKKTGEWHKILVNVGDYREKREESLKSLAEQYIQEAVSKNETVVLPPLAPSERRIIHMYIGENQNVVSESIGEGRDRRLTIKPKTAS